ncbi:MAG: hypothetical protein ACRBCI_11545 [Cellvibrionaceae bacterium]
MKFLTKAVLLTIYALGCAVVLAPLSALAADKPNILVMNMDSDKDTVPRNNRVSKRVQSAIVNQLSDQGLDVYDETAVTLDNFKQGRQRRPDAELIDISKSIQRPPMDVAIFYSIYASAKALPYTTKISTRIEGRIFNVKTGQRLGNFEVDSPREWTAEPKCSRECILEAIGDAGKILADDLGAVLTEKLVWLVDPDNDGTGDHNSALPNAYTIIFSNFTEDEVAEVEEFMLNFSGYKTHRPVYISKRRAEFWYETSLRSAVMNGNIKRMLDHLDLNSRVQFSGNTFTIQRITLRGESRERSSFNKDW